ncbi:MAG TPA: DUF4129 domain-containing protein [Micromonosporaceae bacterium]|jgi:hypothetical protein|nr:DUF4129 domain-containing protein [Micromonosporaceae bacterium]
MSWLRFRSLHLVWVVLLFGVVAVTAAVTDPEIARVPQPSVDSDQQIATASPTSGSRSQPPTALAESGRGGIARILTVAVAIALFLALLAVLLVLLWQMVRERVTVRRTDSTAESRLEPDAEPVRQAVAAGLEELDLDGVDPRSAVIACWLRLERAAAIAGTPRQPSDTPGDLVARMLVEHEVSQHVLDRLADVYRQARYAPGEVGQAMRDEARDALRRLDVELATTRRRQPAGLVTDEPG